MDDAGLGGIFQHRHEPVAHALEFDFARPPWSGPGGERIEAAAIELLDPEPHQGIGTIIELTDQSARVAEKQSADGGEPNGGAFVGVASMATLKSSRVAFSGLSFNSGRGHTQFQAECANWYESFLS